MPAFFLGMILMYLFAFQWPVFPLGGLDQGVTYLGCILPGLTIGLTGAAWYSRLLRSSMLDILNADFVKAARAKGLPERRYRAATSCCAWARCACARGYRGVLGEALHHAELATLRARAMRRAQLIASRSHRLVVDQAPVHAVAETWSGSAVMARGMRGPNGSTHVVGRTAAGGSSASSSCNSVGRLHPEDGRRCWRGKATGPAAAAARPRWRTARPRSQLDVSRGHVADRAGYRRRPRRGRGRGGVAQTTRSSASRELWAWSSARATCPR